MPAHPPYEEQKLLQRASLGDQQAFQAIFDHYWDRMYGNILYHCKDPELASDIAQELFVNLWRNRSMLKEILNLEAFLHKAARNLVLMALRKKVFAHLDEDRFGHYFTDDGLSGVDLLEMKELEQVLKTAIDTLPAQMKRAFTLHRFQGLTHEQIGKEMNISKLSSQTYVARAIVILRETLAKHKGEAGLLALILLGA